MLCVPVWNGDKVSHLSVPLGYRMWQKKESKLELVASKLGVELDDAHDAAADVTATLDILGIYTSRLRQTEGAAIAMQRKEKTRKYFKI